MILDRPDVDAQTFEAATGWQIEPEGACKGEICVPLGNDAFDVLTTAERLGMAVVHEPDLGVWSLGPETLGGRSLTTAEAPELVLPDINTGEEVRLSSLRGQKVVIAAWAPY